MMIKAENLALGSEESQFLFANLLPHQAFGLLSEIAKKAKNQESLPMIYRFMVAIIDGDTPELIKILADGGLENTDAFDTFLSETGLRHLLEDCLIRSGAERLMVYFLSRPYFTQHPESNGMELCYAMGRLADVFYRFSHYQGKGFRAFHPLIGRAIHQSLLQLGEGGESTYLACFNGHFPHLKSENLGDICRFTATRPEKIMGLHSKITAGQGLIPPTNTILSAYAPIYNQPLGAAALDKLTKKLSGIMAGMKNPALENIKALAKAPIIFYIMDGHQKNLVERYIENTGKYEFYQAYRYGLHPLFGAVFNHYAFFGASDGEWQEVIALYCESRASENILCQNSGKRAIFSDTIDYLFAPIWRAIFPETPIYFYAGCRSADFYARLLGTWVDFAPLNRSHGVQDGRIRLCHDKRPLNQRLSDAILFFESYAQNIKGKSLYTMGISEIFPQKQNFTDFSADYPDIRETYPVHG